MEVDLAVLVYFILYAFFSLSIVAVGYILAKVKCK